MYKLIFLFVLFFGQLTYGFTLFCSVEGVEKNIAGVFAERVEAYCHDRTRKDVEYRLTYQGYGIGIRTALYENFVFSCPFGSNSPLDVADDETHYIVDKTSIALFLGRTTGGSVAVTIPEGGIIPKGVKPCMFGGLTIVGAGVSKTIGKITIQSLEGTQYDLFYDYAERQD